MEENRGKPERKLLALLGSPHTGGTTAGMLDRLARSAKEAGWKVDTIHLYAQEIECCKGCRSCLETGRCVQKDDALKIAVLLRECDVVALAAPVYWANVPGVVKNLFDRLLGVAMEETAAFPKPRLPGKRYLLLTACHTPAPFSRLCGQSRGAVRAMEEFFKTAGMRRAGVFVCAGTGKRKNPPEALLRRIEKCL